MALALAPREAPPLLRGVDGSGPLLFARYAFGPNRLGLCGPEDWRALLELGSAGLGSGGSNGSDANGSSLKPATAAEVDRGLRELAAGFEGAYPYLALIANANGIADPLDRRVVDAYWLGSALSDRVPVALMSGSLEARFRSRLRPDAWRWLARKPQAGARPTHAFHVLDVFPRVGLMRGGDVGDVVGLMDACRVRWGTVREVRGERIGVESAPLELVEGRLRLGEPRVGWVRGWLDGRGFLADVAPGDTVSLHWDWACEALTPGRLAALRSHTLDQLRLANETT